MGEIYIQRDRFFIHLTVKPVVSPKGLISGTPLENNFQAKHVIQTSFKRIAVRPAFHQYNKDHIVIINKSRFWLTNDRLVIDCFIVDDCAGYSLHRNLLLWSFAALSLLSRRQDAQSVM